jgi:hypothetical protein
VDADVTLWNAALALAAGKQVFVVSPYEWTFADHERCRRFDSLEAAVRALAPYITLIITHITLVSLPVAEISQFQFGIA